MKNYKEFYHKIKCYTVYRDGVLQNLSSPYELIIIGINNYGMILLNDNQLQEKDVILANLVIDGLPYDKIMMNVIKIVQHDSINKCYMEFIGSGSKFYKALNDYLEVN